MDTFQEDLYQKRAEILLKLLDVYLDKRDLPITPDMIKVKELPILVDKTIQESIVNFLRSTLQCKVTHGKDHFGQLNGYLMISLENGRLNQTGLYQGALALQKLNLTKLSSETS